MDSNDNPATGRSDPTEALAPQPTEPRADVAEPPASGPSADTARALAELDDTALAGHPEIYQRIHADLQGALADIDNA